MTTGGAKHWIDKNLWAILAVGMGLYGGYLTGQATTEMRMETLEKQVAKLEAGFNEMHPREK